MLKKLKNVLVRDGLQIPGPKLLGARRKFREQWFTSNKRRFEPIVMVSTSQAHGLSGGF